MTALADLRRRYLDLVEAVVAGTIAEDPPIPSSSYRELTAGLLRDLYGVDAGPTAEALGYNAAAREAGLDWPSQAFTMIGHRRLRNFRTCIETALADAIPGDIVETGVWRGGASILARAVLAAHGITDRRVILADSFRGLPPPDPATYPDDAGSRLHEEPVLAVSEAEVRRNFEKFGLLDGQVGFVPGWFRDTMPGFPARQIAVLRLDGDMYESTIDPLRHLWDRLSPAGFLIIDDYSLVPACRRAVSDFFAGRNIMLDFQRIDGCGVFTRKPGS